MEELEFRIVLVPSNEKTTDKDYENYLNDYKKYLKECQLKNISITVLKIERSEDENFAEIEELVLQVHADIERDSIKPKSFYYKKFCIRWKSLFFPQPSPLLLLHTNNSFLNHRQSSHTDVKMRSIAFGVLPFNGEFFEFASLNCHYIANFLHDERRVVILYDKHEITFTYANIRNVFVNIETNEVFFDLGNPPLIYVCERKGHNGSNVNTKCLTSFIRPSFGRNRFEHVDSDIIGRSNVLRLTFMEQKEQIVNRIHFRCSEKPIYFGCIISVMKAKPREPDISWDHFGCTYMLTALFRRNFTLVSQTTSVESALRHLRRLTLYKEDSFERALILVLAAVDTGKVVNFWLTIEKMFSFYIDNKNEISYGHYIVPNKCRVIRRITITPTRQILWPPEVMMGNRVLRNFNSEFSLRVSFRDDNHSRLSFHVPNAYECVFNNAIRYPMNNGIHIGLRHFEFLAWSNSQIRDHGVWMYAKDSDGKTVKEIREWMGDFSHIRTVSKYMARMGQCFSQTEDVVSVPFNSLFVRTEPDIEGGYDPVNRKQYCFSDGIGKISCDLASQVHEGLGHDKYSCAFQIRYGGYKGMLVIDPALVDDADIVFRESMKKFDSPESIKLEIARTSAPTTLQLNRPFIAILNDLGVRHRTFLKLQEDMLRNLTDMLIDEPKSWEYLNLNTSTHLFNFKTLSKSGIYLTTEPFFRSLLLTLHRKHVDKIKTKANLQIDPSLGRNMLGVLDETGLLKEGEVFVQYTEDVSRGETTKDTKIVRGTVVVTRNPCLFPGDVRKFTAVDIEELHHIVDCIAFPRVGERPHPNEMSGGDLDGDEFAVIWNEDLIFHRDNYPPDHFKNASTETKDEIKVEDMIEFLVKFIKNDQVGNIASAHLAQVDQNSIFSDLCLDIAKKFSFAVDFAKTGVSAHLQTNERPTKFPDFMERHYQESYKSKKALGKMYRVVRDYEAENEEASLAYCDVQMDKDLVFPGWQNYEQDAIESRKKYFSLLKSVLRNYGIGHEAEVFSGAFTNLHCHFRDRKDKREIEKVVILSIKNLANSMRQEFHEEFTKSGKISELDISMLQKASAWYVVTYREKHPMLLSFPWIVFEYLANIKLRTCTKISPFSPIIAKMDQQIDSYESRYTCKDTYLEEQLENYYIFCDIAVIKKAVGVLLLWAEDEHLVTLPNNSERREKAVGLIYRKTFINLLLYVAEKASYISRERRQPPSKQLFSASSLCLEFLRYCLKLRFYNNQEILDVIPFAVYKYTTLSKRAVLAYHRFAVFGEFQTLARDDIRRRKNCIEMKPVYIDSKLFSQSPIDIRMLQRAQMFLMGHSNADNVWLREIRLSRKVLVSAFGTEQSLKSLKCILRKKPEILSTFLKTGKGLDKM